MYYIYSVNNDNLTFNLFFMRTYYHVIEDCGNYNIGAHGFYNTKEEAEKEAARLQGYFPNNFFYVHTSNSKKEPEFITL
jgi:hypothetical protein